MKKLIDVPADLLTDLKILAAKAGVPVKLFIEQELIKLIKKSKNKNP
jgi:NTP pyrophosphatase (non-canonical NTP hydrolase)